MTEKKQDNTLRFAEESEVVGPLTARACSRSLLLIRLWQEERLREMRQVSKGSDFQHPVVLELHAKASYAVLKEQGRQAEPDEVRHFIDCWLSFLFHPDLFRSLPRKQGPSGQDEYRLALVEVGEKMVRKYAEQQGDSGEQFIRHWQEDYAVLNALSGAEKKNVALYTPALARQAGIAERILSLVQGNQDAFAEQESYLAAGALYSRAGPALLSARKEQYDAAKKKLAALKKKREKKKADPFLDYGFARVGIACGLFCLDRGRYKEAKKLLTDTLPLPCSSSGLKQVLLTALDQDDRYLNPDWLAVAVHVLSQVHKCCPDEEVKKVFCSVLTHQAVLLHNEGSIDRKVLLASMKKAVSLNPDDDFARMTFDDARMDAEMYALHQTMSAGKLNKASRIASRSSFREVVDQFFLFAAQVVEQVEAGDYPDDTSAFFMVNQLLESASEVDPEHEMIRDIAVLLDELEERMENP